MKQSLQLKISQQLTMTPQLQQSIKLLQLSTLELNQEVERYLQENPLLEREESDEEGIGPVPETAFELRDNGTGSSKDSESGAESERENDRDADREAEPNVVDEGFAELWQDHEGGSGARHDGDDENDLPLMAPPPSLREYLEAQLGELSLGQRDRALLLLLIDCLDDDGYLTASLDELRESLPEELEVEPEELSMALHLLQHLEPTGVGARNLSECLLLQLANLSPNGEAVALAQQLVKDHLDVLAARDYTRLKKLLKVDEDTLRAAILLVQSLNPRPCADYSGEEARYVIPDVVVKKVRGVWQASLNPAAVPKIRVHAMYADIVQHHRETGSPLASQLQEAKWLVKNVQQRFETILRVAQAIVERQYRFFEHGEVAMRPLVLRDIAETLELHESTISRVTTQKYMHTPRGVFELKYFFGSHVDTETGGECSAIAIRALIKQLVSAEDQKKPLSDNHISEILAKQGIVVARRTVAKYREALQIPPASQRKSI